VFSFCSVSVFKLSSVKCLPAYTDVNGTVYPNCANVPLRIYSLAHSLMQSMKIGKAVGCNNIEKTHLLYAYSVLAVVMKILFNGFIKHGYVPNKPFARALLFVILVVKNVQGNPADITNISIHQ